MTDLLLAYSEPNKYAVDMPIEKIVSEEKVDEDHVQQLTTMDVSKIEPILVIKHPDKEIYAVLDGHHRLKAARLMGAKTIRAVVVDDITGMGFEVAREEVFQPSPAFTRFVRLPIRRFIEIIQGLFIRGKTAE